MHSIKKYNYFHYKKGIDYTASALTYMIFENIDFKTLEGNVSFFRCDFRGSTFKNVKFDKNNFDRADFISCTFIDCSFENVDLGRSQIKNCYFSNCKFERNIYNTNTLQISLLENCILSQEKIMSNIYGCRYVDCSIYECDFNRSSVDKSTFTPCTIKDTNFATLHAECITFISCNLEKIKLGLSYLFGYLYSNTSLSNAECLYRGKIVTPEFFNEYACNLYAEKRFSEYFNSLIIRGEIKELPGFLSKILSEIVKSSNEIYIDDQISNLLSTIIFYIEHEVFNYNIVIDLLEVLYSFEYKKLPLNIQMDYHACIDNLMFLLQKNDFSDGFYAEANRHTSIITFCCDTNDYDAALNATKQVMDEICKRCNLDNGYFLLNSQKGSWILTYVVVSTIALFIPKLFKYYTDTFIEFNYKKKLSKKLTGLIEKSDSIKKISEITNVADQAEVINQNYDMSDDFLAKKVIESIKIDLN